MSIFVGICKQSMCRYPWATFCFHLSFSRIWTIEKLADNLQICRCHFLLYLNMARVCCCQALHIIHCCHQGLDVDQAALPSLRHQVVLLRLVERTGMIPFKRWHWCAIWKNKLEWLHQIGHEEKHLSIGQVLTQTDAYTCKQMSEVEDISHILQANGATFSHTQTSSNLWISMSGHLWSCDSQGLR